MESHKVRGTKVTLPYPLQLTPAEIRLVFRLQRYFEPAKIFPELYLPRCAKKAGSVPTEFMLGAQYLRGSEITQIDCLAVGTQGIFVFESKDYAGYIYGRGTDRYWTQVAQYGQAKYRFYNPVRQNQTHILALEQILGQKCPIYSVIAFGSDATLKDISALPERSFAINHAELPALLQKLPTKTLSPDQETAIQNALINNRILPTPTMRRDHANDTSEFIKS